MIGKRQIAAALLVAAGGIMQAAGAGLENQWIFSAGGNSSIIAGGAGYYHSWGRNATGQLGLGDNANRSYPAAYHYIPTWRQLSIGKSHALGIQDGRVVGWGGNSFGQLGNGTTTSTNAPGWPSGDADWISVCVGIHHSMGLKADGRVYTWGRNNFGQLGTGAPSGEVRTTPVLVPIAEVKSIACGENHNMAIKTNGTLWAWGYNAYGNLGDNTSTNRFQPVQAGLANGTSTYWIAVSAGITHTVGLRADGAKAYAWGNNEFGQLGDGTLTSRFSPRQITLPAQNHIVNISAGGYHTLAVTVSGGLWAWGRNTNGQLGTGTNNSTSTPTRVLLAGTNNYWMAVQAGLTHSLGLLADGTLMSWGSNSFGELGRVVNGSVPANKPATVRGGMRQGNMSTANNSSFLIKSNGTLWSWGSNSMLLQGRGGNGNAHAYSPTQITSTNPNGASNNWVKLANGGSFTMFAIRAGGTLWSWGTSYTGEMGNGNSGTSTASIPTRIGGLGDSLWKDIDCGGSHCVAIKSDGTLWSWGRTYHGNSSSITTVATPTRVGTGTRWISAVSGGEFTAAIQADGSLWVWGTNDYGQLGLGDWNPRAYPTQRTGGTWTCKAVDAGSKHLLVLSPFGHLFGSGANDKGQLGNGNIYNTPYVSQVFATTLFKQFSAAYNQSVAIGGDDMLHFWGHNSDGQKGNGEIATVVTTPYALFRSRIAVNGGLTIHSLDYNIFAWGLNSAGQVGNGGNGIPHMPYPDYITTP